jgi:hypothetical protein
MTLFYGQEPDTIATMRQAQDEHIRNSGGAGLYCEGDDREYRTIAAMESAKSRAMPVADDGSNDIDF